MTTRRQMAEMTVMQERVVAALRDGGSAYIADRLIRCMKGRLGRRSDGARPWTCRSPGCVWCGRTLIRRWSVGIERWITHDGAPVSLAVLPLQHDVGQLRIACEVWGEPV